MLGARRVTWNKFCTEDSRNVHFKCQITKFSCWMLFMQENRLQVSEKFSSSMFELRQ